MSDHYDRYMGMEELLGTNLISRQAAIEAIEKCHKMCCREDACGDEWIHYETVLNEVECIPPIQPKRETATVSVGKSKAGVTMWYECAACGEPVDPGDTFCSGCGRELIHE